MIEEQKNKNYQPPNNELPRISFTMTPRIQQDPHLEKKCICFTCECGACRCEYFRKIPLRFPVSTYQSQHQRKQTVKNLQFNNERWQYKPNFQVEEIKKQNQSLEVRKLESKSPPIKNDFDFHRIFAYKDKIQSSYTTDFSPQFPTKSPLIEPQNHINIMQNLSNLQNYYLKTRKKQLEPISLIIDQEPNLKEKFQKSPLKNREISYSVKSTYKEQYQKYKRDDSESFQEKSYRHQNIIDRDSLTLDLKSHLNPKLQVQSTFKHDFVQLPRQICKGRMEKKIQRNSHLIDSKYYS